MYWSHAFFNSQALQATALTISIFVSIIRIAAVSRKQRSMYKQLTGKIITALIIVLTRSTGTVHTSAKARLTRSWYGHGYGSGSVYPWSGSPLKVSHWFTGSSPTLSQKFHANRFGSFRTKLLTEKQTDKQRRKHNLLGGGNNDNSDEILTVLDASVAVRAAGDAAMLSARYKPRCYIHKATHQCIVNLISISSLIISHLQWSF